MEAWLRRKRRREVGYSLFTSLLALVAGLGAVGLILLIFWLALMLPVTFVPAGKLPSLGWPLVLTLFVSAWLFIDTLRSRRDDFSNLPLWLLRELAGIAPRLLLESYRRGQRALLLARLDVPTCAAVLGWLARQPHSVPRQVLLKAFPDLAWSRLEPQLHLIDGVIFLRSDFSRITLAQPLRLWLRNFQAPSPPPEQPAPEPPPPVTEPERLSSHEILGVSPAASLAEIKLAYRARVKECHPDLFAGMDEASRHLAEEWTKALNAAYASLVAERTRRGS